MGWIIGILAFLAGIVFAVVVLTAVAMTIAERDRRNGV